MRVIGPILFLLFIAIGIIVAATGALALGSLLSHVFAVTTFEATVVVLVIVAAGALVFRAGTPAGVDGTIDPDETEEPVVILQGFPLPPRRTRRRRT